MTLIVHRLLTAAWAGALLGTTAPTFAAVAGPIDIAPRYRAATDEYCVDMADVQARRAASLLPIVQCRSKTDWAAERLAIAHD
jgi:hypothetical protein